MYCTEFSSSVFGCMQHPFAVTAWSVTRVLLSTTMVRAVGKKDPWFPCAHGKNQILTARRVENYAKYPLMFAVTVGSVDLEKTKTSLMNASCHR